MKVSISLSDDDLAFIDKETHQGGYASRSAAVAAGIRLLRERELVDSYASAFAEQSEDEAQLWDSTAADGLDSEEWPDHGIDSASPRTARPR